MPQETRLLSADQLLLTALVFRLALVALLATMLVRFRLFRRILLTERRDWPERLVFAAGLGIPLTAGVAARLLLQYDAADLTLSGSYLAGLIAGPYSDAVKYQAEVRGTSTPRTWGTPPSAGTGRTRGT